MFGNRDISCDEWLAARKPVDARIATTRKKLSRVTTTTVLDGYVGNGESLRSDWGRLDLTKQHAIVAAVLDHAVIASAVRGRNTFDENRVTPVWKK